MICPNCKANQLIVTDSDPDDRDNSVRRRRKCLACGQRITTKETIVCSKAKN